MAKIMFAELIFILALPLTMFGSFTNGMAWLGLAALAMEIVLVLVVRAQVQTYRKVRRAGEGEWRW